MFTIKTKAAANFEAVAQQKAERFAEEQSFVEIARNARASHLLKIEESKELAKMTLGEILGFSSPEECVLCTLTANRAFWHDVAVGCARAERMRSRAYRKWQREFALERAKEARNEEVQEFVDELLDRIVDAVYSYGKRPFGKIKAHLIEIKRDLIEAAKTAKGSHDKAIYWQAVKQFEPLCSNHSINRGIWSSLLGK